MDLKGIGKKGEGQINPAQDRDKWRTLLNAAITFEFNKCGEFFTT